MNRFRVMTRISGSRQSSSRLSAERSVLHDGQYLCSGTHSQRERDNTKNLNRKEQSCYSTKTENEDIPFVGQMLGFCIEINAVRQAELVTQSSACALMIRYVLCDRHKSETTVTCDKTENNTTCHANE